MDVRIRFDQIEPPQGAAALGDEDRAFSGWLGLLHVLSELLGTADAADHEPPVRSGPWAVRSEGGSESSRS